MKVKGTVRGGAGHFTPRMTRYKAAFDHAAGVELVPGTMNVHLHGGQSVPIRSDAVVQGENIEDGKQDFLIEKCLVNGFPAFRIRPYDRITGSGGWGDHVSELASTVNLRAFLNLTDGSEVEIEFFRDE